MKRQVHLLFIIVLLWSCANPIPPTGGPKDVTPPVMDKTRSSINRQTNFEKQDLIFTFDEFLVLDKADLQVLVSPPLDFKPKIELKDKSVHFKFDDREVLKPNTTYIINFGEAVKDFREGNIVQDFIHVFSTGPHIDSLKYRVQVWDEADKKEADKATVMLFSDLGDTAIYQSRPDYAARTNKAGIADLIHMRPGTYQVIALKDENLNYRYDLSNEKAGFLHDFITLPYEGSMPKIRIFARNFGSRISNVDSLNTQRIRINLDPSTEGVKVRPLDSLSSIVYEIHPTFIDVYYQDTMRQLAIELDRPLNKPDTIRTSLSKAKASKKVDFKEESLPDQQWPLLPGKPVAIALNHQLASIDNALIGIETAGQKPISLVSANIDSVNRRVLWVHGPWSADSTYIVTFQKKALTSTLGFSNDSLVSKFKITNPESLGSIAIKIDSLNQNYAYVIKLIKKDVVWKTWRITGTTTFSDAIDHLPADTYAVQILEDINSNGYQDKGQFDKKELPEVIYIRELEQLRENWRVEAEININDFKTDQ